MTKITIKLTMLVILILIIAFSVNYEAEPTQNPIKYNSDGFIEDLIVNDVKEDIQEVRFTSYYNGDGSSGSVTASGLATHDFNINSKGWYTYQDKVVLATATKHCTELKKGVCAKYNELPQGFRQYELYDELVIKVDDIEYNAIVLDVCGASYWNEPLQRYDIFVSSKEHAIDAKGTVW